MRTRDLACLSASFIVAAALAAAGTASAYRRVPGLACQPVSPGDMRVGFGGAWINASGENSALYCPIEEHAETVNVSVTNSDGTNGGGGGTAQSDKFSTTAIYADFTIHSSSTNTAQACVAYYNSGGLNCGTQGVLGTNLGSGFHNLALDYSAWSRDFGGDYTYVIVNLAPGYAAQFQGVLIED